MDERRDPQTNAPDEGELLAAYLAAETDDLTSARIERLLRDDPRVAERLDALARTRQRLQRLDDVRPPPGFRERLDDRLRAERVARTDGGGHDAASERSRRGRWLDRRRFAPLAAAAAFVLVAVIGGASLLSVGGSVEESAETAADSAAEAPAADAPAAEPFAAPDSGGEAAAGEDAAGAQQQPPGETDEDGAVARALPQVTADADISSRLRDQARSTDEPAVREGNLRRRSGLRAQPLCLTDVDATAVDLVERDGRTLLAALVTDEAGRHVALFDPENCTPLRTFAP